MSSAPAKRPYLLRAMHQWMSDSGHTPHVIVDAERAGAEVPRAYVKDGKIVLNLSHSATQRLKLGNEEVEFDARFAGVVHHVRFPVSAVMGIYARETGEGMVFSEQDLGPGPPNGPASADEGGNGGTGTGSSGNARTSKRPQLKVVK
jgi:stringent starvation protein B